MENVHYIPIEEIDGKGLDQIRYAVEHGGEELLFYDKYFLSKCVFLDGMTYAVKLSYDDFFAYTTEEKDGEKFFILYSKSGYTFRLRESEPLHPLFAEHGGVTYPSLEAWLCEKYGERGALLEQVGEKSGFSYSYLSLYEGYACFESKNKVVYWSYQDIFVVLVDTKTPYRHVLRIYGKTAFRGCVLEEILLQPCVAQRVRELLCKRVCDVASRLILGDAEKREIVHKGLFEKIDGKRPKNKYRVFFDDSVSEGAVYEISLFVDSLRLVKYQEQEEALFPLVLFYRDITTLSLTFAQVGINKNAMLTIFADGTEATTGYIKTREWNGGFERLEKTYQQLLTLVKKYNPNVKFRSELK